MSLQLAAKHLASKGRGPDSELVHMAPSEVAGLRALARAHGGTLTTNPDTGLPEAGFLSNILPMVIGAGLAAATGGTSLALTPGMIGLGVGGFEALRTGNLSKGLTAGLGAYGGAGLMGGVTAMGGSAVTPDAMAAANASPDKIGALSQAADFANATGASAPTGMNAVQAGFQNAVNNPGGYVDAVGGGFKTAQYGLAALAPTLAQQQQMGPVRNDPNPYKYSFEWERPQGPNAGSSAEAMQLRGHYTRLADGGPVEQMSDQAQYETLMANGGQMYAAGGMSHLGDYSDGGRLLKGPGDGVSDSIPATIADKRPARLADGEFVVPARIVSELGNGSTEAGARKLYSMMDRIQQNRAKTVGKGKVAVNSRSDKLLPV